MGYKYVVLIIKSQMKLDVPKIKTKYKISVFLYEPDKIKTVRKEKPLLVTHEIRSGVTGLSLELCRHLSLFLFV